jgi:predicted ribosomally synthesized peptide with nif11-like leader
MALKDALLFVQKIFENQSFQDDLNTYKAKNTEDIIAFAQKNGFTFSKEEYIVAYKKNYEIRWMMYRGKKYNN